MRYFTLIYIAALFFLISCSSDSGFQKNEQEYGDIEYRFVRHNPDSMKIKNGDVLFLEMDYYTESGQKVYSSRDVSDNFRMYANDGEKGSIELGISMMHKGDSAIFKVAAGPFYQNTRKRPLPSVLKPDDKLVFHIRIDNIFDGVEYQKQIDEYNERMEAQEKMILRDYVRNERITAKPSESGLYKIVTKPGTGTETAAGKMVTVHFVGTKIDGSEFDNSYKRGEPFSFQLGAGKSILGFEEGISSMRRGEKCRLIFPSSLGYGARGVSGRIEPFSTLIFDVELIDFK